MIPGRTRISRPIRHAVVLTIVIVAAWHYIDLGELWRTLKNVHWPWLGLMFAIATVDRLLMAGKWRQLLQHVGSRARFWPVVGVYYQAGFLQRFVPTSLSGDALRAILVTRRYGDSSGVMASIFVEKLVAVAAAIFIALIGLGLVVTSTRDDTLIQILLLLPVLLLLMTGALYLTLNRPLVSWIIAKIPGKQLRSKLHEIYELYAAYGAAKGLLFRNFLYCVLEQGAQVALFFTAAIALGVDASPVTLVAAITIGQCLRKLAIIFEGWLLGELTMVFVCSLLGIRESQALAFSLLARMVAMTAELPGALLLSRSAAGIGERPAGAPADRATLSTPSTRATPAPQATPAGPAPTANLATPADPAATANLATTADPVTQAPLAPREKHS
jgi:glycosyltransferase 2 family protein